MTAALPASQPDRAPTTRPGWLDPYCPFAGDGTCRSGCPSNRERACVDGLGDDDPGPA